MTTASAAQLETPESVLQRLDWHVVRPLDGLFQGDYRTLFYGQGVDFRDLREYQPRDDIRNIDWNVTARTNRLHVRQYVEDRELTAWFLVDLSGSMAFGRQGRQKRIVLVDFVATLARLLTRGGNRTGALLYDSKIEQRLAPRAGRLQVLRLIHEMLRQQPALSANLTDLGPLFDAALHTIKRRSLIFVVSDFICRPGWEQGLTRLARRHELVAVRLFDRREMELPDVGVIYLQDAETGEQIVVNTSDRHLRRRFHEQSQQREAALLARARTANVDLLTLSTEEDLVAAIARFAALRKRRRR